MIVGYSLPFDILEELSLVWELGNKRGYWFKVVEIGLKGLKLV